LSVQAANATNSASDRATINAEATQLVAEINRVATTTQFNGVNLLDGSFNSQSFQVGANSGQTITFTSIASATSASLGVGSGSTYASKTVGNAVGTTALQANALSINGYMVGAASSDGVSYDSGAGESKASGIAVANAINAVTGQTGVTASVSATSVTGAAASAGATAAGDLLINGVDVGAMSAGASAQGEADKVAAAINAVQSQTGVTATFDSSGKLTLNAADGRNIVVGGTATGATASGLTLATNTSKVTLSSTGKQGIVVDGAAAGLTAAGLTAGAATVTTSVGTGVSSIDLTTSAGAQAAITTIDAALNQVNSSAGALGAYQNRFTSAVTNLQTTGQNLTAARSRIEDTDFAATTAQMTRGQILQQAGTAILAQANSQPNMVLSLLK
jgi:flagellin